MAITKAIVTKLILKYIGGSKVKGNAKSVYAGALKVVVKSGGGLGGLGGIVKKLSSIGNITDITNNLLKNPIADSFTNISDLTSNLSSSISSLPIPGGSISTMLDSVTGFNGELVNFKNHTDILSGLNDDVESFAEGQLSLSDLSSVGKSAIDSLGMSEDEVLDAAGSIFKGPDKLESISKSFNSAYQGGITDIVKELQTVDPTDTNKINILVDNFTKTVYNYKQQLYDQRLSDLSVQNDIKLKMDTLDTITAYLPDDDDPVAQKLFDRVATDSFKEITSTLKAGS